MEIQQVADRMIELCKKGDFQTCYDELYSTDVVSIEPEGAQMEHVEGLEGIAKKGEMWQNMVEEFHGSEIGDPIVADNFFAIPWSMKVTFKGAQEPTTMDEICVYEVQNGKVVKEQFFFTPENGEEE